MLIKAMIELDGLQFEALQQAFRTHIAHSSATLNDIQRQVQAQLDFEAEAQKAADGNVADLARARKDSAS